MMIDNNEIISSLEVIELFISAGFVATYLSPGQIRENAKDLEQDKWNIKWYSELVDNQHYKDVLKSINSTGISKARIYDPHVQEVLNFINNEYQYIQSKSKDSLDFVSAYFFNDYKNKFKEFMEHDSFYYQFAGKIKSLSNKFSNYKILKTGEAFNEKRILSWLKQFERYDKISDSDEKKRLALIILDNIFYYQSAHFQRMSTEWWKSKSANDRENTTITLFGKMGSSSALVTNVFLKSCRLHGKLLKDIPEIQQDSLKEALAFIEHFDKSILFIDDIIGSGTQSVRMFSEWLGMNKGPLKEISQDDQLSPKEKDILKKKKVIILVLIGLEDGLRELELFFKKNGYNINIEASESKPLKKAFDFSNNDIFYDKSDLDKAKSMAKEIGYEILEEEAQNKSWQPEDRKLHSLGFGDYQQLIVFDHGPPKITLPILWKGGMYRGEEWKPLFPRPEEI